MSMFSDDSSYCNVTPTDDSIIPAAVSTLVTDDQQFYIKINVEIIHPQQYEYEEEEVPDYTRMVADTRDFEICIPVDRLYGRSGPHTSWYVISRQLRQVRLPLHVEFMLFHKICSCAEQMASANENVGRKVLPMFVSVSYVDVDDDYQQDEYTTDDNFVTVPASESALESLEKVTVEDLNVNCAICLERMEIGLEAKKIKCGHCFHGDCIVDWLRVSNMCPLCRLSVSAADSG